MHASLAKPVNVIGKVVDSVAMAVNAAGAGVLALMMFVMTADVCLRYFFRSPFSGVGEIIEFMMALVVTFGLAYGITNRQHITVDLLSSKFPSRIKALIESATSVLSISILAIITWRTFMQAGFVMKNGYVSQSLSIPVFPFFYAVAFSFGVFSIRFFFHLRDELSLLKSDDRAWGLWGLCLGIILTIFIAKMHLLGDLTFQLTPFTAGLIAIGLLLALVFSGMYLGIAMGLIGFIGLIYVSGVDPAFNIMGTGPYRTSASYSFSVIPLFILMGTFCFYSGLSENLYYAAHKFFGHFSGGLAMATVVACAAFAAVSGSGMATAATMGKVALPEMRKYKYDIKLATGSIAAGGSMGILIPPSTVLVLYGILTQQSIGKLFLAGFIPGVLEAIFYMIVISIICKCNPLMGPKGPRADFRERLGAIKSTWGVLALFLLVIGGIYSGIFTPTEAAGIGSFGAFIFIMIRRKLTWRLFASSIDQAAQTTSVMFFAFIGAMIFGSFLSITQLPVELAGIVAELTVNRYLILVIIIAFYLFMGAFLDIVSTVILTVPIITPIMESLGFDLIWFGIVVVRLFEMGAITPPIGMNVFVLKGVAKDVPISVIYRGILPFFISDLIHLGLLIAFPAIVTFLPDLMW